MKGAERSAAGCALCGSSGVKNPISVIRLGEEGIVVIGPEATREGSHEFGVPFELTNLLRLNGNGDRIVYFALDELADHSWTHQSLEGFAALDGRFVGCRV